MRKHLLTYNFYPDHMCRKKKRGSSRSMKMISGRIQGSIYRDDAYKRRYASLVNWIVNYIGKLCSKLHRQTALPLRSEKKTVYKVS